MMAISTGCSDHAGGTCTPTSAIKQLLHELRASELYKALQGMDEASSWALQGQELSLERAAVLLWLAAPQAWAAAASAPALMVCGGGEVAVVASRILYRHRWGRCSSYFLGATWRWRWRTCKPSSRRRHCWTGTRSERRRVGSAAPVDAAPAIIEIVI